MTKSLQSKLLLIFAGSLILTGCSTAPKTPEARQVLRSQVNEATTIFKQTDPDIQMYFNNSYGYAVFPEVYKGAFLVGGAYGKGQVYRPGSLEGYSSLTQATIGFSFGGEFFREIIFFRDKRNFDDFIDGEYTFSAQVTGVALTKGAAVKADYQDGKAVFVIAETGLMIDASLGGQKFKFTPAY